MSPTGVEVACALMWTMSFSARPARSTASSMAREAPAPSGSGAVMWWASADMPDAGELGVDLGAAGLGVLLGLEHDDARRPRRGRSRRGRCRRGGRRASGSSLRVESACIAAKPAIGSGVDGGLGAAGHDDVGAAGADHLDGVAHGLGAGGAGADGRVGAGAGAEVERDGGGGAVGHQHRHGQREDPARALLAQVVPLRRAGSRRRRCPVPMATAEPLGVDLGRAGVGPGLAGGDEGVLRATGPGGGSRPWSSDLVGRRRGSSRRR